MIPISQESSSNSRELLYPIIKSVSRARARLRDSAEHCLYGYRSCHWGYTFVGIALRFRVGEGAQMALGDYLHLN